MKSNGQMFYEAYAKVYGLKTLWNELERGETEDWDRGGQAFAGRSLDVVSASTSLREMIKTMGQRQGEYQSEVEELRAKYLTQARESITGVGLTHTIGWDDPENAERAERQAIWLAFAVLFELNERRLRAAKAILDE